MKTTNPTVPTCTCLTAILNCLSSLYNYPNTSVYDRVMAEKGQLTAQDIDDIFVWKNGMKLSDAKQDLVDKIKSKIVIVNGLRANFDLAAFDKAFGHLTTIWYIFLLHIVSGGAYPIFDQHVLRAYLFLTGQVWHNIDATKPSGKAKRAIYFKQYVNWATKMCATHSLSLRDLDKALFVMGSILKKLEKLTSIKSETISLECLCSLLQHNQGSCNK